MNKAIARIKGDLGNQPLIPMDIEGAECMMLQGQHKPW